MLDKKGFLQVPLELIKWISAIVVVALTFSFVWLAAQDQVAQQFCKTVGFNAGHAELGVIVCEGWLEFPLKTPAKK